MLQGILKKKYVREDDGYRPGVDTALCDGCGQCARECPEGAMKMRWVEDVTYANLLYPENCTGCGNCAVSCPQGAVVMAAF